MKVEKMKTVNGLRSGVIYVPWWNPIKMFMRNGGEYKFIGWAWKQKVYAIENYYEGWICFIEDQTPENINVCEKCGKRNDC